MIARNIPNKFVAIIHRIRGVKIGPNTWIDKTVIIDEAFPENISIGTDVRIAAGSVIISHSKAGHYLRENYFPNRISKIKICDYSFIGVNSVIMPGVTIGEGCVVVSGSVVLSNTKPYTIVSGAPAKKIKDMKNIKKGVRDE
tara:strand:- start:6180 stop:6605 length:426 start_codon:yes stop_codon:yes gene_type:complete